MRREKRVGGGEMGGRRGGEGDWLGRGSKKRILFHSGANVFALEL